MTTPTLASYGCAPSAPAPELMRLNAAVVAAIDALPGVDPLALPSREAEGADAETRVRQVIERVCAQVSEWRALRSRIEAEYFAAGPIEPLLQDPLVTEIIVNGADSLWVERSGRLDRVADGFASELTFRNFISRLGREAGFEATLDCPYADGRWRGCRVHLIIPPASGDQAVVTLRRHAPTPWTLATLGEHEWASPDACGLVRSLIGTRANFLIVGATGSGKTSVLNACLGELAPDERAVIIEDTSELVSPNAASCKLATRHDPRRILREIDQSELVRQALRMRPDRLIMGEIRGGEAKDLLMAFATGHSGCMGTLHAENARQALIRLEMLVQLGAPQWHLQAVRTLIWLSVHAVIMVARAEGGKRKLAGIFKIASLEDVGFLLEKIA